MGLQLSKLADMLDQRFRIERYAEPDGWDFALSPAAKAELLSWATPDFAAKFNGTIPFGLEPKHEIQRAYCLVFPEQTLLQSVIDQEITRGTTGAVVVTHHPLDMETSGRGFLSIPSEQLRALADARVGLYVLHAPLDCDPEISTSRSLAEALGLRVSGTLAPYVGGNCGVIGEQATEPFERFMERVKSVCELDEFPENQVRRGSGMVARIGIVAGGGDDAGFIGEAERLGCDTYLAGHWWTPHAGDWCDQNRKAIRAVVESSNMNFLSGSHDGSELVVFRDRLVPLLESWGIETVLVRQDNHWR